MIKSVIYCDTSRFFLPYSARENNKVIKYIVYTNIRYWHISDNNRPWLSPAIIISTGPGRINWISGRSPRCPPHIATLITELLMTLPESDSGGELGSLWQWWTLNRSQPCPRPLATLSEYSIKSPAPSHLGKYSHRILGTGLALLQTNLGDTPLFGSDLETWKATPGYPGATVGHKYNFWLVAWQWGLPGQCHLLAGLQVLGHNSAGQPLPLPPLIHNHYWEDSSNAEIWSKYSKPSRNIDYQRSFCVF